MGFEQRKMALAVRSTTENK